MDSKPSVKLNRFIAYALDDGTGRTRIGHLDEEKGTITPLAFESGTAIQNLYELIEVGEDHIIAGSEPFQVTDKVNILAPLAGRDVIAIGKNYSDHVKEIPQLAKGFGDDVPAVPIVFTKRSSSVIANEEDILLHENFTDQLDYEGEIGLIIGKGGHQISEADAPNHVWGYTIINDVSAREKQKAHMQAYIGKSADSYCPMGPVVVSKHALPQKLTVTTHVNGEKRQEGTTDQLIFGISTLIKTLSDSQTLRPGDVIATGTPAGVAMGMKPEPKYLKPGDVVEVSVSGIGTLRNKVVKADPNNYVSFRIAEESTIPINNLSITNGGLGLTQLPSGKRLNAKKIGSGPQAIVFIHGLGGDMSYYIPVVHSLGLDKDDQSEYTSLLFDLEGHGMSPTKASSKISVGSYSQDIDGLLKALNIPTQQGITIVAHSMGCLVASLFAYQHPNMVSKLILIGPPPCPLPAAGAENSIKRAATVRAEGMRNVAIAVATAGTSEKTKSSRPLSLTAVQMSLLSQDPEGYAKGCTALAGAKDLNSIDFSRLGQSTKSLIITGEEDKISPPAHVTKLAETMNAGKRILQDVGHWHVFEDVEGVVGAMRGFLE